jgi:hypothetical protein
MALLNYTFIYGLTRKIMQYMITPVMVNKLVIKNDPGIPYNTSNKNPKNTISIKSK